jgi:hypothetical protein
MDKWKRIFKYTVLVCSFLYLSIDVYIYLSYKRCRFPEVLPGLINRYSKIPNDRIPQNIIEAYETVFPGTLSSGFYPDLAWLVMTRLQQKCFIQLELASLVAHDSGLSLFSLANQLDNRLTHEQCIYAYLSEMHFNHFADGVDSAATIYYHKPLKKLNKRECLELVIISENPSLYDKWRNQELIDAKVKRYLR